MAAILTNFVELTRCNVDPLLSPERAEAHIRPTVAGLPESRALNSWPVATDVEAKRAFEYVKHLESSDSELLQEIDAAIGVLRLERYMDNAVSSARQSAAKAAIRKAYYLLRPMFPVWFRKHLQRSALSDWKRIAFPSWPVDTTVEQLVDVLWVAVLQDDARTSEVPFVWFWPDGHESACMMTHDVETRVGRDFCGTLMQMEQQVGIASAFEIVPEERYPVPSAFLQDIRDHGCEVCIHGLNHDGRLFSSYEVFHERARRINSYAEQWGARGFRSPVMYRNLDWLGELQFSFDMSVPNVAHLDPQRGGCCTVMPYFIGNILELPLTTIQDYSLFNIVKQRSLDLWNQQIAIIRARNGLTSFIVHPDYVCEEWSTDVYRRLLQVLAELRESQNVWLARPGEIDQWWRARDAMRLACDEGTWRVVGAGAERARVAFARLEEGKVRYRVA